MCRVQIMKFKAKDLEINMLRSLGVAGDQSIGLQIERSTVPVPLAAEI